MKHLVRDIARIKEIIGILADLGFHQLIDDLQLKGYLPFLKRRPEMAQSHEETVRLFFEHAGGAFIKLGQLLAMRPDLVGPSYSKEFEKLLDDIDPLDLDDLEPTIGASKIKFDHIDKKAIAAGSIAQVHKAKKNKKQVAVKIKIPSTDDLFGADIEIMEFFAKRFKQRYNPQIIDPVQIIEEFKRYTRDELDFNHEARNLQRFAKNFKNSKTIVIPKVIESSKDVLVMEYIKGRNVFDLKKASLKKRRQVIKKITEAAYTQLFIHGFFHADLHPGNIFILENQKICLLDCGIVGYVDEGMKNKLTNLFIALIEGRLERVAQSLVELNVSTADINVEVLKEGLYHALGEYYDVPLSKMPVGEMVYDCIDVARRSRLRLPSQIILFAKSIISLEGLCRELDPAFNIVTTAKPYVKKMLKTKLSTKLVMQGTKDVAQAAYHIISSLPQMTRSFSRKMSIIDERMIGIDDTFQFLTRVIWKISRLIVFSLMFSAIIVSSALLINNEPKYFDISIYSIIGAVSALLLIIIMIYIMKKEP